MDFQHANDNGMHFNRFTLAFAGRHGNMEPVFYEHYFHVTLRQIRIAITAAAIFYGFFGLLDVVVVPDQYVVFWIIRWAIVCPCILLILLFSFSRYAYHLLQPVFCLGTLIAGLGIIAMTVMAKAGHNYTYVGGLVQIIFFIFTFSRLRFIWATAITWCLIVAYLVVAMAMGISDSNTIIGHAFHLSCISLMGMMASYAIEYHTRRNFFLSRQLESKKRRLAVANQFLEERVAKRTAELRRTNELLRDEINERKAIEIALSDSEKRYRRMFETAAAGMMIVNVQDKRIIEVNPAAAGMMADTIDHIKGKRFDELIEPAADSNAVPLCMPTRHPKECTLTNSQGKQLPILTSLRGMELNGQQCWIVSFVNILQIKEAEAAKSDLEKRLNRSQHLESIGTLAGGIAHDFNNILFGMMGFTELALDEAPEGSQQAGNLHEILRGGNRAKKMIAQILAFSRQDSAERQQIQPTPLIKEALKLLRASLPATIELQTRFAPNVDSIDADPTQIHQIIMNLCTNAAYAMGSQGGRIEIALENINLTSPAETPNGTLPSGDYIRLMVTDNGEGISPEVMDRIFEPFFTTKDQGQGSGMGLSMILGIVQAHNGSIMTTSKPGKGARFEILLPAVSATPMTVEPASPELPKGMERILFVDDERSLGLLASRMLFSLGYRVTTCEHPVEALNLFKGDPQAFDLIITDLTMPKMTGTRLAQQLLKIRPGVPILLCTGYGEEITQSEIHALGIRELLLKPILKYDMAAAIRRVLDDD